MYIRQASAWSLVLKSKSRSLTTKYSVEMLCSLSYIGCQFSFVIISECQTNGSECSGVINMPCNTIRIVQIRRYISLSWAGKEQQDKKENPKDHSKEKHGEGDSKLKMTRKNLCGKRRTSGWMASECALGVLPSKS